MIAGISKDVLAALVLAQLKLEEAEGKYERRRMAGICFTSSNPHLVPDTNAWRDGYSAAALKAVEAAREDWNACLRASGLNSEAWHEEWEEAKAKAVAAAMAQA